MGSAGHRCRPHTADLIIEAWAPSRSGCLNEALRALVESFADVPDGEATVPLAVRVDGERDEDVLVGLLDEVVYTVEVLGQLPVSVCLDDTAAGGVAGFFATVPIEAVELIGALPKGVSRSGLSFGRRDGMWRCHALVDV